MSDEKKHEDMLEINRIWLGEGNEDDKLYTIFQYTQKIRTQQKEEMKKAIFKTINDFRDNSKKSQFYLNYIQMFDIFENKLKQKIEEMK